jgi:hypothetical protein
MEVAADMGILDKVKAKEFLHTDEMGNVQNETLVRFNV